MFVDGGKWKIKVLFVVRIIPNPFTDLQHSYQAFDDKVHNAKNCLSHFLNDYPLKVEKLISYMQLLWA